MNAAYNINALSLHHSYKRWDLCGVVRAKRIRGICCTHWKRKGKKGWNWLIVKKKPRQGHRSEIKEKMPRQGQKESIFNPFLKVELRCYCDFTWTFNAFMSRDLCLPVTDPYPRITPVLYSLSHSFILRCIISPFIPLSASGSCLQLRPFARQRANQLH